MNPGGIPAEALSQKSAKSLILLVGVEGFEPPTPSSRTMCATRLRYTPRPDRGLITVQHGHGKHERMLKRIKKAEVSRIAICFSMPHGANAGTGHTEVSRCSDCRNGDAAGGSNSSVKLRPAGHARPNTFAFATGALVKPGGCRECGALGCFGHLLACAKSRVRRA